MSSLLSPRYLLLLLSLLMAATTELPAQEPPAEITDPVVKAILKEWRSRQNAIASFNISLSGTQTDDVGTAPISPFDKAPAGPLPPVSTTFAVNHRFVAGANQEEYEFSEGKQWNLKANSYLPSKYIRFRIGTTETAYFPQAQLGYPFLSLSERKDHGDMFNRMDITPLALYLRPLSPRPGMLQADQMTVIDHSAEVGEISCVLLSVKPRHYYEQYVAENALDFQLWVDPARNWLPIRYLQTRKGKPEKEVVIVYQQHEQFGWTPDSWVLRWYEGREQPAWTYRMSVDKAEFNQALDMNLFQITPPKGCWVNDGLRDETYLIKLDGTRRNILPGEYTGTNYEELLNTNAGDLLPKKKP